VVVPVSATGSAATGAFAVVASSALVPPEDDLQAAWLDADPRRWQTVGDSLLVHRERPTVRVRRADDPADEGSTYRWHEVQLTRTEELLLRALLAHPGEPASAEQLFAAVWADDDVDSLGLRPDQGDRLRRLVFQLRQRVEPFPSEPRYVCTVRGVGYALYSDEAPTR
jgi:hypothetical protein